MKINAIAIVPKEINKGERLCLFMKIGAGSFNSHANGLITESSGI